MWLIPGKTKVKAEIFKGVGIMDILVGMIGIGLVALMVLSNLPYKYILAIIIFVFFVFLLLKIDNEPNYRYISYMLKHLLGQKHYVGTDYERLTGSKKKKGKDTVRLISAFTDIKDNMIVYGTDYYGAVVEIPAVEFRFFSEHRKANSIVNGLGKILRNINPDYCANIIKLDRPLHYDNYIDHEYDKLEQLKKAFEAGYIREDELKSRVEIIYDRINELEMFNEDARVYSPCYYFAVYDSDRHQLEIQIREILEYLHQAELKPRRLNTKELALFLKYSNYTNVDEEELDQLEEEDYATWAMPDKIDIKMKTLDINNTVLSVKRIISYPTAVSDAWLATVMSMPGTKVVLKCKPMDREKAVKAIDKSLNELRAQANNTSVDSKLMELDRHIQSLAELLETIHGENESLLQMNIYVTTYDIVTTERVHKDVAGTRSDLPRINNINKSIRRLYRENGLKLTSLDFQQLYGYIGSQISAYDPFISESRGVPSNTVSAGYPWVFANITDEKGIKLGANDGQPVFIDFFRRDNERVNSNMVIVGKSGSGKSYATKSLLTNLAADDSKIFILDPENEYSELAANLHGKLINVGNAQYGRMNPFNIITALDDDETDGETVSGTYATHLQFLEEFFRQILPDCDKDALEYLNTIIDRIYMDRGITPEADLSRLRPSDYPIFDDLYDAILREFQETDNQYIRTMLRTLMNYVQKFAAGGRNANIWNGPSTITTEENFTVFNFQSLLANRNNTIANAQMLLVLKYIDNEIIKNREYNIKNNANRKIIVVVDEAHVFIDDKFPVALDFMYQLAKRIRKYNGMQIVITQNIKDFVGTEEIARKSTAIINACQYSFIFSLAPNDMDDLCKLYEKAGGINENEQEQIVSASRGHVFTVLGPESRSAFKVEVPENVVCMFEDNSFTSKYFEGEGGYENWEDFVGDSRDKYIHSIQLRGRDKLEDEVEKTLGDLVTLEVINERPEEFEPKNNEEVSEDIYDASNDETSNESRYHKLVTSFDTTTRYESKTEEKLTELVEKLSGENLDLKIESEVRNRLDEIIAKMQLTPGKQTNAKESFSDFSDIDDEEIDDLEDDEEDNFDTDTDDLDDLDDLEDDDFSGFFDEDSDEADDDEDSDFEEDEEDEEDDDDDLEDEEDGYLFGLDDDTTDTDTTAEDSEFMKMFSDGVSMASKMSAIEMMHVYDEQVAQITLEDLDQYIMNVIINGDSNK